jgi:hypothetical protein
MGDEPLLTLMKPGFRITILTFAILALLSAITLEGKIRTATLVFLGGFGAKTWIAEIKRHGEDS